MERFAAIGADAIAEDEVAVGVEVDGVAAKEPKSALSHDRGDAARDCRRVDAVRLLALQPQEDRHIGGMSTAGGAERPVQVDPDPCYRVEQAVALQARCEQARGAHRPDGVRAGWADADLEEVECADGHGADPPCPAEWLPGAFDTSMARLWRRPTTVSGVAGVFPPWTGDPSDPAPRRPSLARVLALRGADPLRP